MRTNLIVMLSSSSDITGDTTCLVLVLQIQTANKDNTAARQN